MNWFLVLVFALGCNVSALNTNLPLTWLGASRGFIMDNKSPLWVRGIAIALVGSTLTSVGLLIQKRQHLEVAPSSKWPYWLRWQWVLGFAIWEVGNVLYWLSLGYANQSVLACLATAWNIVAILALAPCTLSESVSRREFLCSAVLMTGCVGIIVWGPKDKATHTRASIVAQWVRPEIMGSIGVTVMLGTVIGVVLQKLPRESANSRCLLLSMAAAIFSWYAVVQAKCSSELFATSLGTRVNQMSNLTFWALLLGVCSFACIQVHLLNMAMKCGNAVVVLPAYESASLLGQVVFGAIFFSEFDAFNQWGISKFAGSVFVILLGILLLALWGRSKALTRQGDYEDDEECVKRPGSRAFPRFRSSSKPWA
mmetsp:Transcript_90666/g.210907  ORF Transcript_90666/g.210907 Transcript_90666/m.210907 type:complete len:368 (-) Transcript_90666:116-1219(-)